MNISIVGCVALLAALTTGACTCPDTSHEDKPFADRSTYATEIDACLAMDTACESLCRKVLNLDMHWLITKCIVTSQQATGVQLDVAYFNPGACEG